VDVSHRCHHVTVHTCGSTPVSHYSFSAMRYPR
jgi:hypothetical protein